MIILLVIAMLVVAAGIYWMLSMTLHRNTEVMRSELEKITLRVNSHLEQTATLTQKVGDGTVKAIGDLYGRLGKLEESTQRIFDVGHEISKLQEVLRSPKARGGFGELMLGDLLGQVIPRDHYTLQHPFRNGTRVDAAIFVGSFIVPIDAKFPLENFTRLQSADSDDARKRVQREFVRDVKHHINEIADRYISPEEGTLDFALMYIPAENVYYEVITLKPDSDSASISEYALSRRVIPVSPNSFYAYLQVILMGLRGLRIDQTAREIAESLVKLRLDFEKIGSEFGVFGTHLNHLQGSYAKLQRNIDRFQGKLASLDQTKGEIEHAKAEDLSKSVEEMAHE